MICIPLVNLMSGRLAIFHPLEYSFIKNSGAYLKILKEPLRRNWNLALQAWLRFILSLIREKNQRNKSSQHFSSRPPNGTLKRYCHRSYSGHLTLNIPISGINPPILTRKRGDEHPCYFCRGVPVYQSLCCLPRSHFCLVTQHEERGD